MYTQKIFKAGNSTVVAIPKELMRNMGFKVGRKVVVAPAGEGIMIKRADAAKAKALSKGVASKEFQKWLDKTLVDEKETIEALAKV